MTLVRFLWGGRVVIQCLQDQWFDPRDNQFKCPWARDWAWNCLRLHHLYVSSHVYMDANIRNKGLLRIKKMLPEDSDPIRLIRKKLYFDREGWFMLILFPDRVHVHTPSDQEFLVGVKYCTHCACATWANVTWRVVTRERRCIWRDARILLYRSSIIHRWARSLSTENSGNKVGL